MHTKAKNIPFKKPHEDKARGQKHEIRRPDAFSNYTDLFFASIDGYNYHAENRAYHRKQYERDDDVYAKHFQRNDKRRSDLPVASALRRQSRNGTNHKAYETHDEKGQIYHEKIDKPQRFVSRNERARILSAYESECYKRQKYQNHGLVVRPRNDNDDITARKRKQRHEEHFERAKLHIRARNALELSVHRAYARKNARHNCYDKCDERAYYHLFVAQKVSSDKGLDGLRAHGFHHTQNILTKSKIYDKINQNTKSKTPFRHFVAILKCYHNLVKESETKIKKYLLQLGFQPNLKGYRLLAKLIEYAQSGMEILPLKYAGYVRLASDFGVDKASVEKDIQNAISSAWLRGDVDMLYREFGETLDENKGKPTNKQFVLTALERIK